MDVFDAKETQLEDAVRWASKAQRRRSRGLKKSRDNTGQGLQQDQVRNGDIQMDARENEEPQQPEDDMLSESGTSDTDRYVMRHRLGNKVFRHGMQSSILARMTNINYNLPWAVSTLHPYHTVFYG